MSRDRRPRSKRRSSSVPRRRRSHTSRKHTRKHFEYRSTRGHPMARKIKNSGSPSSRIQMMQPEMWAMTLARTRDDTEDPKDFLNRVLHEHTCKLPSEHVVDRQHRIEYERTCLTTLANELTEQRVINLPPQFQEGVLATRFTDRDDEFIRACKIHLRSQAKRAEQHENTFQFALTYRFPGEDAIRYIHIHFNLALKEFYQFKFRYGRIQASRVYGVAQLIIRNVRRLLNKLTELERRVLVELDNLDAIGLEFNEVREVLTILETYAFLFKHPAFIQDTRVPGPELVGGFEKWSEYKDEYFQGLWS